MGFMPTIVLWPTGCRWCGQAAFYASGGVCLSCSDRGATTAHGPERPPRRQCPFCARRVAKAGDVLRALKWLGKPCRRWHRRRMATRDRAAAAAGR